MTVLKAWRDHKPDIKAFKPLDTTKGVLDKAAFNTIEVDALFNAIDKTKTKIGAAVLYRYLAEPLDDITKIKAKQQALEIIKASPDLKAAFERLIANAQQDERYFYQLLFAKFLGAGGTARDELEIEGYGYVQYRRGIRFILEFVQAAQSLPKFDNTYLQSIVQRINAFSTSRAYALMLGPAYLTEKGIQSRLDRKHFSPAIIFKPSIFKPLFILLMLAIVLLGRYFFPSDLLSFSSTGMSAGIILLLPLALVYFPVVGGFDRDSAIKPLRDEYRQSDEVAEVLDVIGEIDSLLSLLDYAEHSDESLVMPEFIEAEHHKISLVDAKNPILLQTDKQYVGNDFSLETEKLVLITGPNSGGKTAFCKTLMHIQLLAQIGSYVPVKSAQLTVADKLFYQSAEMSQLDDGEGRFGTELKRTKSIFLASTAKSFVVLDELSEGTTFEEKMETSATVLEGFYQKGNNTILITHNHQLVDFFLAKKKGIALQVEFINELPTHKLIEGISRVSHAHRVAKKIGFSKDDIAGYLAKD